jgi:hypothetical protein
MTQSELAQEIAAIREAALADGHNEDSARDLHGIALAFTTIHGDAIGWIRRARAVLDVTDPEWRTRHANTLDFLRASGHYLNAG